MADSISRLLSVPLGKRTARWLRRSLQVAIKLELATIPPYLCAFWSIKKPDHYQYLSRSIRRILGEEMKHLGLACNLMTAFGGTPTIRSRSVAPRYPGRLPGGVHPGLIVSLQRLSKDLIGTVFMQLEFPSPDAVTTYGERQYPTIGSFYGAIRDVIANPAIPFVGGPQLEDSGIELTAVLDRCEALKAIDTVRGEGEGAHGSPFSSGDLPAHYYRFAEMFWERRITRCGAAGWGFCGAAVPFPVESDVYEMAVVPRGGYPGVPRAVAFSRKYSRILERLQTAWKTGSSSVLGDAVDIMTDDRPTGFAGLGRCLMRTPRPDGMGNYGPDFRLIMH
jgi:hypothetical protein